MELLKNCEISRGSNMKASTSNLSNGFLSLCLSSSTGDNYEELSPKIVAGDEGYVFEDVPHFLDYIPKASVCFYYSYIYVYLINISFGLLKLK